MIKKVEQYDRRGKYLATYKSITLAAKLTGANAIGISKVCRGIFKSSGGYRWLFVDSDKEVKELNKFAKDYGR